MKINPETFSFATSARSDSGLFIVVDGVNGAGKGTLLRNISASLARVLPTINITHTREPGGTPLGLELRKILLQSETSSRCGMAEALLFSADRAQHVEAVLKPALHSNGIVLCDRYYYSTVAFQGYGRGLPVEQLITVSEIATSGIKPDLVILLDLDPAEGLRRAAKRSGQGGGERDAFEDEELAFHKRLRAGFLELAERCPEPFCLIDASKSQQECASSADYAISRLIRARGLLK